MSTPAERRLESLTELGDQQGRVVSRRQIYELGFTRSHVRAQVRARRWQRVGTQSVALHTGPVESTGTHWAAVFEAGPRAHLDGASSLIAHGLKGFTAHRIRVSVPKGARIRRRRTPGLDIRETRRFRPDDVTPHGVPRTRPAVAAVHGALWARSDKEAALILTMPVQQGLCTVEEIGIELLRVKRHKRRALLAMLAIDLAGGVRSLSELDFIRGCRERGLPEPDGQTLRRTTDNRYYLDFLYHAFGVVVEVDGIQHGWVANAIPDALRHNSVALSKAVVLRLPVLGLRMCPDEFFEQVRQALVDAGWRDLPESA